MYVFGWLAVAALAAVVEALSAGLITVWFVLGALIAFAAAMLGAPLTVQIAIFLVVSIACLVLLRPVILRHRNSGPSAEPDMIGQTAVVVEPIDSAKASGRVETGDHMSWLARSADGSVIEAGAEVRVVSRESVKLIVERI